MKKKLNEVLRDMCIGCNTCIYDPEKLCKETGLSYNELYRQLGKLSENRVISTHKQNGEWIIKIERDLL